MLIRSVRALCDELFPPVWAASLPGGLLDRWAPDPPDVYCHRCGRTAPTSALTDAGCWGCRDQKLPWATVTRLGDYAPPLRDVIVAMKFRRQWAWATWLGQHLANVAQLDDDDDPTPVLVCPTPMHWRRRWARGFNQAELMARALARERGWPCASLLKRRQPAPPLASAHVGVTARRRQIAQAFEPRPIDLTGWRVLLVDDVKTTGATAHTLASHLQRMNARRVDVLVAAVTPARGATVAHP